MISRRTLVATSLSVAALGAVGYGLWPRLSKYEEEVQRQRQLLANTPTMAELVRMATLAANGHNTQPWKFGPNETGVSIRPDWSRRTEVVDPDDHHLFVSLGCAAENLMIAAGAHGHIADISVGGAPETTIDIALQRGPARETPLYRAIPSRQSTRGLYDGQSVSSEDIALLQEAAKETGVSVLIFTGAADLGAITEFVVEGNSAQMDDPAFTTELREWLRFSPDHAVATGDGLFSACTGNPAVPEWIGDVMFKAFFTKDAENDKYRDHIRSSAGVAVFIGDRADAKHWVKVGGIFQRFALKATTLGIRNAHINQPIEVPSVRLEFARWLGVSNARPDLVVRFGRAPTLPMSLRRPVEEVII